MTLQIDPAAEFLLTMPWINLFESVSASPGGSSLVCCKGCRGLLTLGGRENHYLAHRKAQNRLESLRREKVKQERIARLREARRALGH